VIFHSYVSLPEGTKDCSSWKNVIDFLSTTHLQPHLPKPPCARAVQCELSASGAIGWMMVIATIEKDAVNRSIFSLVECYMSIFRRLLYYWWIRVYDITYYYIMRYYVSILQQTVTIVTVTNTVMINHTNIYIYICIYIYIYMFRTMVSRCS